MIQHCVLFDMDGTLYDSEISIQAIRDQLSLPRDGSSILDQLRRQSSDIRDRGIELLHTAEAEAAVNGSLISGTRELLAWLREADIRCALVTNNSRLSVETILAAHPLSFDVIVTREDGAMKPAPDLFLLALDRLGCCASHAAAVGDTHLDAIAAHRAGIRQLYLVTLRDWMADLIPADVAYMSAVNLADVLADMKRWHAACHYDG